MMILTEDQKLLQGSIRPFLAERGAIADQLRHWRDIGCKDGFGHGLWKEFAGLGLTGMLVAEAEGGSGLGQVEANLVLEEIGRNLTPSPFLTSAVAFVRAVEGTPHAARWLPGIVSGATVAAVALGDENDDAAPRARREGDGFVLDGIARFVVHGASADVIVVEARADDGSGPALLCVPGDAPGLTRTNRTLVDSSKAAELRFDAVRLGDDALVGAAAERARTAGAAGAAAELVGIAAGAFERTVAYLRERRQFGKAIGEFQALQHRAAHLYGEIEIARAATLKAAQLLDRGVPAAARMVSVAKAKAGKVARLAVQEGVQMHGGIGMTDEHDIGLFMKRQAVVDQLFGSPAAHRARLARAG